MRLKITSFLSFAIGCKTADILPQRTLFERDGITMEYLVMNRSDARRASYVREAPTTAIISIADIGGKKNEFYPRPWLLHILEIQFNDVEKGKGCITKKQAKEIANYVCRIYPQVVRIIVHCELGQSRSAGVAAAISQFFEGSSGGIFGNKAYSPNRTCHGYVLSALKEAGRIINGC